MNSYWLSENASSSIFKMKNKIRKERKLDKKRTHTNTQTRTQTLALMSNVPGTGRNDSHREIIRLTMSLNDGVANVLSNLVKFFPHLYGDISLHQL